MKKRYLAFGTMVLSAMLALTGCVGTADSNDASTDDTSSNQGSLADRLPADLKERGELSVITDASYPPFASVIDGSEDLEGLDIDIINAIGKELGLKVVFNNAPFDNVIPGIQAKRYDVAVGSVADTEERRNVVDFVDYLNSGKQVYGRANLSPMPNDENDLCGLRIAIQAGTWGEEYANKFSDECVSAGKAPIEIQSYGSRTQIDLALDTERADISMTSYALAVDAAQKSNDKITLIGGIFEDTIQGIAINKGSTLVPLVQEALQNMIDSGEYAEILSEWELDNAAIPEATINMGAGQ